MLRLPFASLPASSARRKALRLALALTLMCCVATWLLIFARTMRAADADEEPSQNAAGLQAFADIASVLRHPRCINCHPAGDVPHQTDGQRLHFPAVERGAENHGVTGMRCNACHQTENQVNGVPGAPHWSLAPRVMAWEGLNDHELAAQIKDRQRNGGRTLDQLVEHVAQDHLILWAWQPGGERTTPPLSHEQFVQRLKDWIAAGAPAPE